MCWAADGAGTVTKVAAQVTGSRFGFDEVLRRRRPGALGTFAEIRPCMPAATTAHRPAGLSEIDAVSIPHRGLDAPGRASLDRASWAKGPDRAHCTPRAAALGSFAVQLAKHLGATVRGHRRQQEHRVRPSLGPPDQVNWTNTRATSARRSRIVDPWCSI